MDSKKKNILLMIISGMVMIALFWYKYSSKGENKDGKGNDYEFAYAQKEIDEGGEGAKGEKTKVDLYKELRSEEYEKLKNDRKLMSEGDVFSEEEIKQAEQPKRDSVVNDDVLNENLPVKNIQSEPQKIQTKVKAKKTLNKTEPVVYQQPHPIEEKPYVAEIDNKKKLTRERFYTASSVDGTGIISSETNNSSSKGRNTIKAVVYKDQNVKSGSLLKVRVVEECIYNQSVIPKNAIISGYVSIKNERLTVDFKELIGKDGKMIPVELKAYATDGNEGLPIPGGINKEIGSDILNEGMDRVSNNVKVPILGDVPISASRKKTNDPSVKVPDKVSLLIL